jgi:Rab guanine nucleotide exchange factor SEC2
MVTNAREEASKDHEMIQRRNDQLRSQLADTENLLKSHQEQLAELKIVMEQMNEDRDDQTNPTAPSTPGVNKFDSGEESGEPSVRTEASGGGDVSPSYPTSFTHLLHPVLRTDLAAYDDFISLLRMSKTLVPGSRGSSGSYAGIGMGLGLGGYTNHTQSSVPSNGSTISINTSSTTVSSPATPTTPASTTSNGTATAANVLTPLKETRFYKRALAEDIEPTLRLDTAPGLSWLARRTVLHAMCEGTLVVEPVPTSTAKLYIFACSLCGEARRDPAHMRTHRFRTSESDSAQRYPLCKYCLHRVRSSCGFLGFLRVLKDGHWRTDDEESERAAWEESVRLREQMFWCRMGGGVVPTSSMHQAALPQGREKSPSTSEEEEKKGSDTMKNLRKEVDTTGEIRPRDVTLFEDVSNLNKDVRNEAFMMQRMAKKLALSKDDTAEGLWKAAQIDALSPNPAVLEDRAAEIADQEINPKEKSGCDSAQSFCSGPDGKKDEQRLSITIPGAFG